MVITTLLVKFLLLIFCYSSYCTVVSSEFEVYWNIPSFMCNRYNLPFENVIREFNIIGNKNDSFRGDKIAILYDPGKFPAILQNTTSKQLVYRNRGVPQAGDLQEHLTVFISHINELIVDENFTGLAVIDFESWRPVFRQNFGVLKPYKDLSIFLEKQKHPSWSEKLAHKEASKRFELAGKMFMKETIRLAQTLRPNAKWGYYAFPYCFGKGLNETCADGVSKENDKIKWLFDSSDIILPSVYLQEKSSSENRFRIVKSRVLEAIRIANQINRKIKPKIFVYYRYVFTDSLKFISETETIELLNQIKILLKRNNFDGGIILWGSSNDLNTKNKCNSFFSYLSNTLGPAIQSLKPNYSVLTKT